MASLETSIPTALGEGEHATASAATASAAIVLIDVTNRVEKAARGHELDETRALLPVASEHDDRRKPDHAVAILDLIEERVVFIGSVHLDRHEAARFCHHRRIGKGDARQLVARAAPGGGEVDEHGAALGLGAVASL